MDWIYWIGWGICTIIYVIFCTILYINLRKQIEKRDIIINIKNCEIRGYRDWLLELAKCEQVDMEKLRNDIEGDCARCFNSRIDWKELYK